MFNRKGKEKEKLVEEADENQECGLVMQFTPIAVYAYISEDGFISADVGSSGLDMEDLDCNYIGINGNYITIEVKGIQNIENTLRRYNVNPLQDMPVVRIKVRPR